MAVIHHTVLKPSKLELLTSWLPTRPWYVGGEPVLAKAGGFRLDDPEGEVGIEFLVVSDASGPATYLVPLTYRGAPLEGAEDALVGTMEHGVLGRRWAYDGCHDPVLVAQLAALIAGRVQAQDQNVSDTPDQEVTRSYLGDDLPAFTTATDDEAGTELTGPQGTTLRLHRVLHAAPITPEAVANAPLPPKAAGHADDMPLSPEAAAHAEDVPLAPEAAGHAEDMPLSPEAAGRDANAPLLPKAVGHAEGVPRSPEGAGCPSDVSLSGEVGGYVAGVWVGPDGARVRGLFAVLNGS